MSLDFGLKHAHVLITGAAGGIGLELVKIFQQLGSKVTAHYNSRIGELANISNIVAIQADVRNEHSVDSLLRKAAEQNGGPVSVLIVNHGIWPEANKHIADMDLDQWNDTLAIDLTGPFLLCRAYLRALRNADDATKASANVIFIGSTAGKHGEASHGDYAAGEFQPVTLGYHGVANTIASSQVRHDVRPNPDFEE